MLNPEPNAQPDAMIGEKSLSPGTPPGTLVQKLPVVVLSCSDFDDLQSQLGGFSLEMDDLLFAVLGLIELGSLVYIFHSVAQCMWSVFKFPSLAAWQASQKWGWVDITASAAHSNSITVSVA